MYGQKEKNAAKEPSIDVFDFGSEVSEHVEQIGLHPSEMGAAIDADVSARMASGVCDSKHLGLEHT